MDGAAEPSRLAPCVKPKRYFHFSSGELSIRLAASTISTIRSCRQRPVWLSRQASPLSLRNFENHSRLCDCLSHGSAGRGHHNRSRNEFLWNGHRDSEYGGYYWSVGYDGPSDATKQAYGPAFVLLAASSAKVAGHPDADRLITEARCSTFFDRYIHIF